MITSQQVRVTYMRLWRDDMTEYRQEKRIEGYLCRRVKAVGGYAMKITSPGMAGVPDRLVLIDGQARFVELKAPNGKASARQLAVHRKLERLGFPVRIINSKEQIDDFLEEVMPDEVPTA